MVRRVLGPIRGAGAIALALFAGAALGQTKDDPYNQYPYNHYPSDRYPSEPATGPNGPNGPTNGYPNGATNGYIGDQTGTNNTDNTDNTGSDNNFGPDNTGGEAGGVTITQNGPVQTVNRSKQPLQKGGAEPQPSFLLTGQVGVSETFTSNVAGTAGGSESDFDSRLNLGLNTLERSAELTAALSYSGGLDVFARSNTSPVISTNIAGLLDYAVIPDYLRFDLRIFATPVLLNPLGAVSTQNTPLPQGFNSNVSDTYGYQVAPTLSFHFGDFATSNLVPSYGTVWFVRPTGAPPPALVLAGTVPPPQITTTSVVENLTSGEDFGRLYWQLTGNYLKQSEVALGLKQAGGTGDFEYALSHEFYLLAEGGYQSIDSSTALSQNLTGPIAYGGLRVRFSPLSMIEVRAGEEYNSPSYTGLAAIAFTPATGLTGSLDDTIQTPAGRLLSNLGDLDVSVQGDSFGFYNGDSVAPGQAASSLQGFSVTPSDNLGFNNAIERYRTAQFNLYHKFPDTTQVAFGGFGTLANILSAVPVGQRARQTSWGVTLSAQHAVSPLLNVSGFVTWADQKISFGSSDSVSFGATASYNLSKTLSFYGTVEDFDRLSSSELSAAQPISGSANVVTFTVGVTKSF